MAESGHSINMFTLYYYKHLYLYPNYPSDYSNVITCRATLCLNSFSQILLLPDLSQYEFKEMLLHFYFLQHHLYFGCVIFR